MERFNHLTTSAQAVVRRGRRLTPFPGLVYQCAFVVMVTAVSVWNISLYICCHIYISVSLV